MKNKSFIETWCCKGGMRRKVGLAATPGVTWLFDFVRMCFTRGDIGDGLRITPSQSIPESYFLCYHNKDKEKFKMCESLLLDEISVKDFASHHHNQSLKVIILCYHYKDKVKVCENVIRA
jgi:hypothetical protein